MSKLRIIAFLIVLNQCPNLKIEVLKDEFFKSFEFLNEL